MRETETYRAPLIIIIPQKSVVFTRSFIKSRAFLRLAGHIATVFHIVDAIITLLKTCFPHIFSRIRIRLCSLPETRLVFTGSRKIIPDNKTSCSKVAASQVATSSRISLSERSVSSNPGVSIRATLIPLTTVGQTETSLVPTCFLAVFQTHGWWLLGLGSDGGPRSNTLT